MKRNYIEKPKNTKKTIFYIKKWEHKVFRKRVEPPYMVWTLDFEFKGEIMIKGAKDAKVKVIFQGSHMICVMHALVYNII
jgi:hypothetical protein